MNGCGLNCWSDSPIFQSFVIFPSWRLSWNIWTLCGEFRSVIIVILWSFCFENIPTFYCFFLRSNTLDSYFRYDYHFISIYNSIYKRWISTLIKKKLNMEGYEQIFLTFSFIEARHYKPSFMEVHLLHLKVKNKQTLEFRRGRHFNEVVGIRY